MRWICSLKNQKKRKRVEGRRRREREREKKRQIKGKNGRNETRKYKREKQIKREKKKEKRREKRNNLYHVRLQNNEEKTLSFSTFVTLFHLFQFSFCILPVLFPLLLLYVFVITRRREFV